MAEEHLIVSADVVGRKLGLTTLTGPQREVIEDEILDAQDAVVGHLGRPIAPEESVRTELSPKHGEDLMSWRAWGLLFDDEFTVKSAVQDEKGTYTVTFLVGLDGTKVRAIARYVRAHAVEAVRLNSSNQMGERAITSMSAEGQSLAFESTKIAAGDAGALPTLASLDKYVRRSAYQANRPAAPPWPMTSPPSGWDPR